MLQSINSLSDSIPKLLNKKVAVVGVASYVLYSLSKNALYTWRRKEKLLEARQKIEYSQEKQREKRKILIAELRELARNNSKFEIALQYVEQGAWQVFNAVREKKISLEYAVRAYQLKSLVASSIINPVTHFIDDAVQEAKAMDEKIMRGEAMPPLYGMITSVKEFFNIKGTDSTVGLPQNLLKPASADCVIAQTMKQLGAIILVKTNLSQTTISFASSNPIYGRTLNPNSEDRGPGGSSSGEAALHAFGGCMGGFGSDLGGSVRIPAHFCGTSALRPMNGRFSAIGINELITNYRGIESTYGVMAKDVRIIAEITKHLLSDAMFKNDRQVAPVAWKEEVYASKEGLRIGYFVDDGVFPPTPGVVRAVMLAKKDLEKSGHTLVAFQPPTPLEAFKIYLKLFFGDRLYHINKVLKNEIVDDNLAGLLELSELTLHGSSFAKNLFISKASTRFAYLADGYMNMNRPEDLFNAFAERDAYRTLFIKAMREANIDAILSPVVASPAVKLDVPKSLLNSTTYVKRYNLLDLPAGVTAVTQENEEDQRLLDSYAESDEEAKRCKASTRGALGIPIGVQIASYPYNEEVVLRVLKDLQEGVGQEMLKRPASLLKNAIEALPSEKKGDLTSTYLSLIDLELASAAEMRRN